MEASMAEGIVCSPYVTDRRIAEVKKSVPCAGSIRALIDCKWLSQPTCMLMTSESVSILGKRSLQVLLETSIENLDSFFTGPPDELGYSSMTFYDHMQSELFKLEAIDAGTLDTFCEQSSLNLRHLSVHRHPTEQIIRSPSVSLSDVIDLQSTLPKDTQLAAVLDARCDGGAVRSACTDELIFIYDKSLLSNLKHRASIRIRDISKIQTGPTHSSYTQLSLVDDSGEVVCQLQRIYQPSCVRYLDWLEDNAPSVTLARDVLDSGVQYDISVHSELARQAFSFLDKDEELVFLFFVNVDDPHVSEDGDALFAATNENVRVFAVSDRDGMQQISRELSTVACAEISQMTISYTGPETNNIVHIHLDAREDGQGIHVVAFNAGLINKMMEWMKEKLPELPMSEYDLKDAKHDVSGDEESTKEKHQVYSGQISPKCPWTNANKAWSVPGSLLFGPMAGIADRMWQGPCPSCSEGITAIAMDRKTKFECSACERNIVLDKISERFYSIDEEHLHSDRSQGVQYRSQSDQFLSQLEKLSTMYEKGLLTEEEFMKAKHRIMSEYDQ